MPGIALDSAKKGRPRPSFFFLLCFAGCALAQQPVFRCGQEYTNAPLDVSRCEHLAPQAVTVIPGTRVIGAPPPAAVQSPVATARFEATSQKQRDEMARAILVTELDKARQRHAELSRQYQRTEPVRVGDAPRQSGVDGERAEPLRAALERTQRDIDSLQRELERRPATTAQP